MKTIETKRKVQDFPEMNGDAQEMVAERDIEEEFEKQHPARDIDPPQEMEPEAEPKKPALEELSSADLRFLLEQRLLKEAAEAKVEQKKIVPPTRAPKNMMWVFNRAPQKFEWQYDGVLYEIEGHSMELFETRVARHARKRSILSLDSFTNKAVFKVALEGEEKFGVPLRVVNRTELVDRSTNDNPLGRGPGKTHATVLQVEGVADLLSRRQDKFAELD